MKLKLSPFIEEVARSIHQQEHLFLSLGAVSSVQIMLQRHGSLHRADHVNVPLLYTTEVQRLQEEEQSKKTKTQSVFGAERTTKLKM